LSINDIFNSFLSISSVVGFSFCALLLTSKNRNKKSIIYLGLLVFTISINNLQSWILAKNLFQHKFALDYIQIPWHFLIAPFFYKFQVHYLEIGEKSYKLLKIIIPLFLLSTIFQITFTLVYSSSNQNIERLDYLYERYTSIDEVFSLVISLGTFGYSYYILNKKEKLFSKILMFDNLCWLYTFFKIGALGYILWIFALVVKIKMDFSGFIFSYYPLRVYTTVLIYWISYQAIVRLNLLNERRDLRVAILEKNETKRGLYLDSKNEDFIKIEKYIVENNKFTESKISRDILATELKINKNKLSLLINSEANKTFIEYMNDFRINHAKKILINKEYSKYTITAIGLESGFNSKSTFYHIFKKQTGMTPLEYKKTHSYF
jgi:AraC-like DNA-binding protein